MMLFKTFIVFISEKKIPKQTTAFQTVVSMDLRGFQLKDTKIPLNPLNLVTVWLIIYIGVIILW